MNKIEVKIIDDDTLELQADAKKGDIIRLSDINKIDDSFIKKIINNLEQKELNKLKEELEEKFSVKIANKELELTKIYQEKIQNLESNIKIDSEKHNYEVNNLKNSYETKLSFLNEQIKELKQEQENKIKDFETKLKLQIENEKIKHESDLKQEYENYINSLKLELQKKDNIKKELELEFEKKELEFKTEKEKEINTYMLQIDNLKRNNSSLNIKRIGENLENWCYNEYLKYASSGFYNTELIKDTIAKGDDLDKTKADFIFRIYANKEKDIELSSVTLEMKSEQLTSQNKKKNQDHFKKLDHDRIKNKTEYALLVSELEMDNYNDIPFYKVLEYEKMYVVRPAYFISFLQLLDNLANKYKDILLSDIKIKNDYKTSTEIKQEFDDLKETYIIKPLLQLEKNITDLIKHNEKIIESANSISKITESIIQNNIKNIQLKIEKFNINKITKKIDKLNS